MLSKKIYMRYFKHIGFFLIGLFLYSSCGVSGKISPDYTLNQSRASTIKPGEKNSKDYTQRMRQSVTQDARKLIGKRYRYGGCGPNAFDCSGFTQYVFSKNDVKLPRSSREQARSGRPIKLSDIQAGDLVVFAKSSKVSHVGICVEHTRDALWVAHSTNSEGVIMENVFDSKYWSRRVRDGRRVIH